MTANVGLADLDLPNIRFVARAIVELGRPTINCAWSYLTTWISLDKAKVPPKLRRELLGSKFITAETQALKAARRWADKGSTAPIVIIGYVGAGKSFAGADWLLNCRSRGRSIAWVSASELAKLPLSRDHKREADRGLVTLADEELRMSEAGALVLDDIGSGQLSPYMLGQLKSMLLEREAADRPTMVLLNAKVDDGREWFNANMDPRLLDRMRAGGGGAVYLTGKKSLRNDPEEDDIEPDGRGRTWKSAANLIELVGRDDEHDRSNPIYGARLEAACVHGEDGLVAAEAVRRRVGVDPLAVQRRSFELADEDLRLRGIVLDAPFLDQLRDRILDEGKQSTRERERLRVDPDYLRRAGEIQSTGQALGARPAPVSTSKYAVELPDGARARLAAQGVTVRFSSALQEFEVRYKQSKAVDKISDTGRDRGDIEKKHGRLLGTAMSEREAWGLAYEVMGINALTKAMATG
jgi:DNA replication protein DnaC